MWLCSGGYRNWNYLQQKGFVHTEKTTILALIDAIITVLYTLKGLRTDVLLENALCVMLCAFRDRTGSGELGL